MSTINSEERSLTAENQTDNKDHIEKEPTVTYTKDESEDRVKFEGLDNDSICSEPEKAPPIPDGGWGWVVVVAAFLVSACADGLAFSFGLLHEEFTAYFETTQSKTSLIGSLFIATPLLAGPIMSALVDRYGCRVMTMIAGVLSTLGFLLASISNSVEMLCLTFGFLSGLAMGILYVTTVVSVAFWFEKRRNLAVSLASCGIGFGTLTYSPMTHYFLEIYDWRNTIVLLAGTLLNMCVCGALMRNPEWFDLKQKRERKLSRSRSRRSSSAGSTSSKSVAESVFMTADELKALLKSGKTPEHILATLATSIAEAEALEATTEMNTHEYKRMHSTIHLPTFIQNSEEVPTEVIEKLMSNNQLLNIILENYPDILKRRHSEETLSPQANQNAANLSVTIKIKKPKDRHTKSNENNKEDVKRNVNKEERDRAQSKDKVAKNAKTQDWFSSQFFTDHHYFRDMPLCRNTMMHRGAMMNLPRYKLKASSLPDIYRNSAWSLGTLSDDELKWHERVFSILRSTFDFRMFSEFHFLMFCVSSLILSVWFIVPYFFLQSFMTARGVEGGPAIISVIGIASSFGIVFLGWAGDQSWINVTKTYSICLMVCGVSVAAMPLVITDFYFLSIVSTIFGLSFASSYSYTPTLLMELMPIDHFTLAYGLILLSQGMGHLVGPPIAGMLYDITGTWDLTFYMGGAWLVVSGFFIAIIAYTKDSRMCGTGALLKEIEEKEKEEESHV